MNFKIPIMVAGVSAIALLGYISQSQKPVMHGASINDVVLDEATARGLSLSEALAPKPRANFAGAYLSSQFAQRRQQWDDAAHYLDMLKGFHPDEPAVVKRSVVLQMGANNPEDAIAAARELLEFKDPDDNSLTLAYLFVVTGAFQDENYEEARQLIAEMPQAGLTLFMKPLLDAWLDAAEGTMNVRALRSNTMLMMHAAYIADYLQRRDDLLAILEGLLNHSDLSLIDLEKIGDLYATNGMEEEAGFIFEKLAVTLPSSQRFKDKLKAYNPELAIYQRPSSPRDGLALGYYDMAYVLYQDYSDDSARIFANMALYLDETVYEARVLLGALDTRHEAYDDAIAHYYRIPASSPYYLDARREAAGLYEDAGKPKRSAAVLMELYNNYGDLESLIKVGDIYRRQKAFDKALKIYDQAVDHLNGNVTDDFWHLHYVRGMALEQLGQWELAAQELETALTFQPHHPYVLNYLGYALVDRGLDLERALGMLNKALSLQPEDGYITDSVGWAYYKLGQYEKAVPYLETAAELLPADPTINDHLGDAYWKSGRRVEAKYQWMRALGFAEDAKDMLALETKIADGLKADTIPARSVADSAIEKSAPR